VIGNVAKKLVGAVPVVGGIAQSIVNAQENVQLRKQAGEPPALATINGISDAVRGPLSGPNDRQALGGIGMFALVGVAIVLVILLLRK
jgi:hypothetical protein